VQYFAQCIGFEIGKKMLKKWSFSSCCCLKN
jgi:hypothetical protein